MFAIAGSSDTLLVTGDLELKLAPFYRLSQIDHWIIHLSSYIVSEGCVYLSERVPSLNCLYPAFLDLTNRLCVVIGAGDVAARKIGDLVASLARIRVISPEFSESALAFRQNPQIEFIKRPYNQGDLSGAFLVIAATNSLEVNRQVWNEANERGILCNVVDDPPHCSFYAGSHLQRGDLKIAISTNGKAPAMAKRIRRMLEEEFDDNYGFVINELNEIRTMIYNRPEKKEWFRALPESEELLSALKSHDREKLEALLKSWKLSLSD
jgi:precorrin-2 dehydrogenase / sirohydrochlorin ferrochelatase